MWVGVGVWGKGGGGGGGGLRASPRRNMDKTWGVVHVNKAQNSNMLWWQNCIKIVGGNFTQACGEHSAQDRGLLGCVQWHQCPP